MPRAVCSYANNAHKLTFKPARGNDEFPQQSTSDAQYGHRDLDHLCPRHIADLIGRGGEAVVNQPPGRRYTVLTIGGALFGVLLNLGTISLLGTMIREGVDAGRQKNRRPRFRNPVATYDLGHAARVLFDPDVVADHCDPGDHSGVAARYHLF